MRTLAKQTADSIGHELEKAQLRNQEILRDTYRAQYRLHDDLANLWGQNSNLPGAPQRAAAHRALATSYARKLGVV